MAVPTVHPELFRLELLGLSRPIFWYGVLLAVAIAVGLGIALARAPRYGLTRADELGIGLVAIAGGLPGALLLNLVLRENAEVGLVFFGGLLGGALAAMAY